MSEDDTLYFNMDGQDIDGDNLEFVLTDYPDGFAGEDFIDCGLDGLCKDDDG